MHTAPFPQKLYVRCLKSNGFLLDGLSPVRGRHFFLEIERDSDGYPLTDEGNYKITRSCNYDGIDGCQNHEIHIFWIDSFVSKGYIELVEDPTDYSYVN